MHNEPSTPLAIKNIPMFDHFWSSSALALNVSKREDYLRNLGILGMKYLNFAQG